MPMVNTSACLRYGVNVSKNERRKSIIPAAQPSRSPLSPPLAGDEDWLSARIPFCFSLNLSGYFLFCTLVLFKKNCTLKKEKVKNDQVVVATCIKTLSSFLCTVAK